MALRFRRSLSLLPGVRLNLTGGGASVRVGVKVFGYPVCTSGQRITVGLPGTGLYYTQKVGGEGTPKSVRSGTTASADAPSTTLPTSKPHIAPTEFRNPADGRIETLSF